MRFEYIGKLADGDWLWAIDDEMLAELSPTVIETAQERRRLEEFLEDAENDAEP